jgi:hypothetical protein
MLTPDQELQYTLLADLITSPGNDWTGSNKLDKDTKMYIMMSLPVCYGRINSIVSTVGNITNQKFLVLDTIEDVLMLLFFGVNTSNIVFRASDKFQVEITQESYEISDTAQCSDLSQWVKDKNMNLNEFIVVGNLPFTDGTSAQNNIYTPIIGNLLDQGTPKVMSLITPEGLVNGNSNKDLRKRFSNTQYGFSSINFLNQTSDWGKEIKVDTVAWTLVHNYAGTVTVKGRNSGKTYTTPQLSEYVNGETQVIHDWILSIQTPTKIKLKAGKKTSSSGNQLKISKTAIDGAGVEHGSVFDSDNGEWRVAFGYLRCNTIAIVPPGLGIPNKYKYRKFGQNEQAARKWAAYMMSTHVRFIMNLTYTSRSLDNPQLSYVPEINLSAIQAVSDSELDQLWNTPGLSNTLIPLIGNKVPY